MCVELISKQPQSNPSLTVYLGSHCNSGLDSIDPVDPSWSTGLFVPRTLQIPQDQRTLCLQRDLSSDSMGRKTTFVLGRGIEYNSRLTVVDDSFVSVWIHRSLYHL